jgi:hypothetical protein
MPVKAQGTVVPRGHVQVDAARAPVPQGGQLDADELTAVSLILEPGEQVDVEVGRVAGEEAIVGAPRVVDQVGRLFVRRPLVPAGHVGLGVASAQRRPPALFQPLLEGPGVQRAQAVAAHAELVFHHERQGRLERAVRSRVDVAEQVRVPVERCRVVSAVSGPQADQVQITQITGAVSADDHGRAASRR